MFFTKVLIGGFFAVLIPVCIVGGVAACLVEGGEWVLFKLRIIKTRSFHQTMTYSQNPMFVPDKPSYLERNYPQEKKQNMPDHEIESMHEWKKTT